MKAVKVVLGMVGETGMEFEAADMRTARERGRKVCCEKGCSAPRRELKAVRLSLRRASDSMTL